MSEESSVAAAAPEQRPNPLKEITQPFVDLVRAPRALWGVNLSYLIEGLCYFGWLTLMALSFNKNLGLDDHKADLMVGLLTGGITLSMLFFGGVSDKWGVRRAMIVALLAMLAGRIVLVGAGIFLPVGQGLWSPMFWAACVGLLGIVLGYGLYQPAAYSAVRQFCDERSSAMAYAMLYALMNLGGFLPGLLSPAVRNYYERAALGGVDPATVGKPGGPVIAQGTLDAAARTGINAVFWVYVGLIIFGRPPRTTACDCERAAEPALPQTLFRMTDQEMLRKFTAAEGRAVTLNRSKLTGEALVDELFLSTLSRFPNAAEKEEGIKHLADAKNRQEGITDLLWALVNTREFILNH